MAGIDKEYDSIGRQYNSITDLPIFQLEWLFVERALGDCTGKSVLDLGGGTGLHARQAIDHGASFVDNVDISPGMLRDGESTSTGLGRKDSIRWLEGDISKPLDHLDLVDAYDIVIIGWTFDHAESDDQLEGMWRNVSRFIKPGGRLVNVRIANPQSPAAKSGKYGIHFTDFQDLPGGLSYKYHAATTPIFSCPGTTMTASMDFQQAKAISEHHGFVDYQKVPAEELQIVKDNPEFWQLYLQEPFFVCVTAHKKA